MKGNKTFAVLLAVMLLCGCGRRPSLLPHSGGKPFEVLVVGDLDGVLTGQLTLPVAGLPQQEPCFDVSSVTKDRYNDASRLARNIVCTDIDAHRHHALRLRYAYDVYASPQLIVTIEGPSLHELSNRKAAIGAQLRRLFTQAETSRCIADLETRHASAMSRKASALFGVSLLLPPEMNASKEAEGFLWISDDGRALQRSICLYTLPLGGDLLAGRDSVMALHLPGEEAGMHVRTATAEPAVETADHTTVIRGLWEMTGDVMGGPFVLHARPDTTRGRILVAEAMLYAPGALKRNEMHRLESILHTLRPLQK